MTGPDHRRGITLLEVLISIGILAIGLSSVAALITAARSQAGRAVVLDRAAVLAANALADAATFGVLIDGALTVPQTSGSSVLIDTATSSAYLTSMGRAGSRVAGIFSGTASGTAPAMVQRLLCQARDDLVVAPGATEDDPPNNVFIDGLPGFEGKMTCLVCLTSSSAGEPGRLSVVVFHGRDPNLLAAQGTITGGTATIPTGNLGGRTLRDVVKPGVVLWHPAGRRFHQAVAAAVNAAGSSAFLTLSTGTLLPSPATVQFLPDSVGLAEQPCFPETAGPYTR